MTILSLIIPNEKDLLGLTLLHKAVKEENIEAIKELILLKFDINALTNYNNSPLHYAYETGNLELIDLLVKNGANTNKLNYANKKPNELYRIKKKDKINRVDSIENKNNICFIN